MQSLVHLITTLSDVREFNKTNHGLIFANTLHHAQNRGFLWTLFWMKNLVRVVLVIVALSVTAHFHLTDLSVSNGAANHSKLKLIYSEKATKFCEISTLLLTTVHTVISKV